MGKFENNLWILKSKGDESSFGGNTGYPDQIDSHYVYDTTVKNHDKLRIGDFIILTNKKNILGYATVTSIDIKKAVLKIRYRCPICNIQEHSERKNIIPKYKCRNKHEFNEPREQHIKVDEFTAHYSTTYKPVLANTSVKLLDGYYIKRNKYYSIQAAKVDLINNKIFAFTSYITDFQVIQPDNDFDFDGFADYTPSDKDEREDVVRSKKNRKGQQEFKDKLIKAYGSICMITGCNIKATIEASHICPYRGKKDNNPKNGLLLRVDLHRLFDNDFLGIDPETLKLVIHPVLRNSYYEQYEGNVLNISNKNRSPSRFALDKRWKLFQNKIKVSNFRII